MSRRIAQQIHRRASEIILCTEPLIRWCKPHLLPLAFALQLPDFSRHLGVDEAGGDGIDANALGGELDAEDFGEHGDGTFGGVVGGHAVAREGDMCGLRCEKEDAAWFVLLDELLSDELDGEECPPDL